MTAIEINAEILRNMSIIAEDEKKEIAEGKGVTFTNKDDMNAWLNSL